MRALEFKTDKDGYLKFVGRQSRLTQEELALVKEIEKMKLSFPDMTHSYKESLLPELEAIHRAQMRSMGPYYWINRFPHLFPH